MPVDQSGENIVFRIQDGYVEAHIQIQYTGDPKRFAWIVPVPAVPEVTVGSRKLFSNLLAATVPTVTVDARRSCNGTTTSANGCDYRCGAAIPNLAMDFADGGAVSPHGRKVTGQAVGAFDVSIVQPASAGDVMQWLRDNGFVEDPAAPPILARYIEQGHVFVAVKLLPDAGVDEIHPLVLRYPGSEPCIPIELTSIAAVDDMGVRAFFLSDRRVVPTNYSEVVFDPVLLDWPNAGTNYTSVVSRAVDAPGADGHAFVTEYAGSTDVVSTTDLVVTGWNPDAFRSLSPGEVVSELVREGFVQCFGAFCTADNPLLVPLLRKYLPATVFSNGYIVPPTQCTGCTSGFPPVGTRGNSSPPDGGADADAGGDASTPALPSPAPSGWNGEAFAHDVEELIVKPEQHAKDVLESAPYLTRLFTTLSPDEMTLDPTFAESEEVLPSVSSTLAATEILDCNSASEMAVPGHTPVRLGAGEPWPNFVSTQPAAERVIDYDTTGKGVVTFDNHAAIERAIQKWNGSRPPLDFGSDGGGCGCAIPGAQRFGGAALPAFAALALAARRLRRKGARRR
jgi:hypothetical protein